MAKVIGGVTATPNPNPDWNQTDPSKADYIKNKPNIKGDPYIKTGEYLYLGVDEAGQPILWRCVGMRDEGALMVSDKILTYKAFGASEKDSFTPAEDPTDTAEVRQRYGKGMWSTSALRLWLNTSGDIPWADEKKTLRPSDNKVTANPYNKQKGFCTGFTDEELSFVKRVRNDAAVNECDESAAYSGHLPHKLYVGAKFGQYTQNYFGSAYLQSAYDLFFCLNTAEVVEMNANLYDSSDPYNTQTSAKPTEYASRMCESKYIADDGNSYYWLRDGYGNGKYPECARCVYPSGRPYQYNANNGNIGVRPAFVLARGGFTYGDGTAGEPYRLTVKERDDSPVARQKDVVPDRPFEKNKIPTDIANVNVGDYIKMGEMDGVSILWRCVDVDTNGALFVSDKALRFFPFSGKYTGDKTDAASELRREKGTNRWKNSAIRCWLNSGKDVPWKTSEAQDYIPEDGNVYGNYPHYDTEAGFLSCFTDKELSAIKTASIKSAISICDVAEGEGKDIHDKTWNKDEGKYEGSINAAEIADKVFMYEPPYGKTTLMENYGQDELACVSVEGLFTVTAHKDSYAGESGNNLSVYVYYNGSTTTKPRITLQDGTTAVQSATFDIPYDNDTPLGTVIFNRLASGSLTIQKSGANLCVLSIIPGKTLNDFNDAFPQTHNNGQTVGQSKAYYLSGGNEIGIVVDTTEDKMFLLNHPQLKRIYEQFEDYILAKPTPGAVAYCNNAKHKYPAAFRADTTLGKTWHYWTRDAHSNMDIDKAYNCNLVCDVTTDGRIGQDNAYDGQYGIRPAFYADANNMEIASGTGTESDPYEVKRE